FFLWGAMGWASLAPQQHILLAYQPQNGSIAVALNSSVNYLGSSIGATLCGVVLAVGFGSMSLVYFALFSMIFSISLQLYSIKNYDFMYESEDEFLYLGLKIYIVLAILNSMLKLYLNKIVKNM